MFNVGEMNNDDDVFRQRRILLALTHRVGQGLDPSVDCIWLGRTTLISFDIVIYDSEIRLH